MAERKFHYELLLQSKGINDNYGRYVGVHAFDNPVTTGDSLVLRTSKIGLEAKVLKVVHFVLGPDYDCNGQSQIYAEIPNKKPRGEYESEEEFRVFEMNHLSEVAREVDSYSIKGKESTE
jgi:hypothetical protein